VSGHTVLVLGGYGQTGRRLIRLLVQRSDDLRVVVAGRDAARAAALAVELDASRVRGIGVDAADAAAVAEALQGVDLLVNLAVVPQHVAALVRVAMAAGSDWLDFQINRAQAHTLDGLAEEIAATVRSPVMDASRPALISGASPAVVAAQQPPAPRGPG
jgi:saccharopine dehydrogenase-like NADP-dependent oxidoreductase